MAFLDLPKKKTHLWKKATLIRIFLFFIIGIFAGFTPTSTTSTFTTIYSLQHHPVTDHKVDPIKSLHFQTTANFETLSTPSNVEETESIPSRKQLVIIMTTPSGDRFQDAFLTRMAHTLRLVPPPLLWIVVGAHSEASKAAELLRETGIMYRHLTFKENFTDPNAENDHQRNVALNHIEKHRLDGIVNFAGMFNTYDLQFFEEIRDIMMLRWWPAVEGLIDESSNVLGRQSKDLADSLSGLAFNSSILWNTERQTHPPSQLPEITQDYNKFLQQVLLEVQSKTTPIPRDCSRIMMWHLRTLKLEQGGRQRRRVIRLKHLTLYFVSILLFLIY